MNIHITPPAPSAITRPSSALPSHRLIMEAAMVTYRRWRAMGEPHEAAIGRAFELIRRVEHASREACR